MLDHRVQSGEGYVNARTQGTVKGMCYIGNNYSTPLGRPYWDCNVHQPECMTHTYGTECMTHIYGTEVGEPWWVLVVDDFPDEQQLKAAPWYTCKGFRVFGQEGG